MAIIKCPECGREVSDQAKQCPHCGNIISKGSIFYTSIVVGAVIALLGIFTGLYIAHDREALSDDVLSASAEEMDLDISNDDLQASNLQSDSLDWLAAQETNTFESYLDYLQQHPDGSHSLEARDLIEALASQLTLADSLAADSAFAPQPADTLVSVLPADTLNTDSLDR